MGYIDNGMACSTQQLILGNENIGMAKRFIRGIEVNQETLARELIAKVGPGGQFLTEKHTFKHFKNELWMPKLNTRKAYEEWERQGSKDMAERIQEKLDHILAHHQAPQLPDQTLATIRDIRERGVKALAPEA